MLSAKGNLTGAIWHYEEALNQKPDHAEAFQTLRMLKCYQKFHRTAQSAAPKDITAPGTANCQKAAGAQVTKPPVESRVLCKNVSLVLLYFIFLNCLFHFKIQGAWRVHR